MLISIAAFNHLIHWDVFIGFRDFNREAYKWLWGESQWDGAMEKTNLLQALNTMWPNVID